MKTVLLIASLVLFPASAFADPLSDLKFPEPAKQTQQAELDFRSTGSVVKPVKTEKADARKPVESK